MVQKETGEAAEGPSDHGKTRCMKKEETEKKCESKRLCGSLCGSELPGSGSRQVSRGFSAVSENQTKVLERPRCIVF